MTTASETHFSSDPGRPAGPALISPVLVLRAAMVVNRLCTLPKTFSWVLHNEGQPWDEEIKRDLLKNCPSMETLLLLRVQKDLKVIVEGLQYLVQSLPEENTSILLEKSGLLKLLVEEVIEPRLVENLMQNFYLGRLGPDSFVPSRRFKRDWSVLFKAVARLYHHVDLVDPINPMYKSWVSLKRNIGDLDNRFGILFDIPPK